MYKLVVLFALLAVALARPGLYESALYSAPAYATVALHEPSYAHVGSVVKSVPSAVSHQSQTVVHSADHVVEDILAPAIKSTLYQTKPLVAPYIGTYVKAVASAPVVYKSYAAETPLLYKSW